MESENGMNALRKSARLSGRGRGRGVVTGSTTTKRNNNVIGKNTPPVVKTTNDGKKVLKGGLTNIIDVETKIVEPEKENKENEESKEEKKPKSSQTENQNDLNGGDINIEKLLKNIRDNEEKIVKVQKLIMAEKNETKKSKLKKTLDSYEKIGKALLLRRLQYDKQMKMNETKEEKKIVIHEVEDEYSQCDDGKSIMSDITMKTANSKVEYPTNTAEKEKTNKDVNVGCKLTPIQLNRASRYQEENQTKLEMIGSTRKKKITTNDKNSKSSKNTNQLQKSKSDSHATNNQVKQDDCTIMSEITKVGNKNTTIERKGIGEPRNNNPNNSAINGQRKGKNEEIELISDDEKTVMSECTKKTKENGMSDKVNDKSGDEAGMVDEKREKGQSTEEAKDVAVHNEEMNKDISNGDKNSNMVTQDVESRKENEDDDVTIMSECPKTEKVTLNPGIKTPDRTSHKTTVKNPYITRTPTRGKKVSSYAEATKEKNNEGSNKVSNNANKVNDTHSKFVRLRFTFIGRNFNGSKRTFLKQIIYETMQCAKEIDKDAGILPWEIESDLKALNGNELMLQPAEILSQYADIPNYEEEYQAGVTYYGNGLRVKTKMDMIEFLDRWNFQRYNKKQDSPFKQWKAVKAAETQKFTKFYPVGYMSGTTERGDYTTVIDTLKKEFKNEIDISFQSVFQTGVSQKVWEMANKAALAQFRNTASRDHKMIKFALAPTALVIYTDDEAKVKELRSQFIDRYGDLVDGRLWPQMSDGSRMRFIPIVRGFIEKKVLRNKLLSHLKHQATSKAGEVKIQLRLKNIRKKYAYLKDQSVEEILHGMATESDPEIPLFKHITTRWIHKEGKMEYEVAVASKLVDEAAIVMRGLKNRMVKEYGNQVRVHFIDANTEKNWTVVPTKRKLPEKNEDWDDDLDCFLRKTNNADKLSMVLIEGMEKLIPQGNDRNEAKALQGKKEDKVKDSVVKNSESKKALPEKKNDSEKTSDATLGNLASHIPNGVDDDELTGISEGDESFIQQVAWNEITLVNEYSKCKPASKEEMRKAINSFEWYKIEISEIDKWKRKNWEGLTRIMIECEYREYSAMKRILEEIRREKGSQEKEKKKIIEDQQDVDNMLHRYGNNKDMNTTSEAPTEDTTKKESTDKGKIHHRASHPQSKKSPSRQKYKDDEGPQV